MWLDYYIHEYIHIIARQFTSAFSKLHFTQIAHILKILEHKSFHFQIFPGYTGFNDLVHKVIGA